jgi:hypothetical protein
MATTHKVRHLGIDDWVELSDPKSGRLYYYSKTLKKTQWEMPTASNKTGPPSSAPVSAPVAAFQQNSASTSIQTNPAPTNHHPIPASTAPVATTPSSAKPEGDQAESAKHTSTNLKTAFSKHMAQQLKTLLQARQAAGNSKDIKKLQFWDITGAEQSALCLNSVKAIVFNPQEGSRGDGKTATHVKWECWTSIFWLISGGFKVKATETEVDDQTKAVSYRNHECYINGYGVIENWNTPLQLDPGVGSDDSQSAASSVAVSIPSSSAPVSAAAISAPAAVPVASVPPSVVQPVSQPEPVPQPSQPAPVAIPVVPAPSSVPSVSSPPVDSPSEPVSADALHRAELGETQPQQPASPQSPKGGGWCLVM